MFSKFTKQWGGDSVPPYSRLAEIYDYVMRHVDYVHWADFVEEIFERYEARPSRVLELACGTGSLSSILAERGYSLTGIDRSEAMVQMAREKAGEQEIEYLPGDMMDPPVDGPFDAVLCLYDSINYLMEVDRVENMLGVVRDLLVPDGMLVFDACTEINSRRFFNSETEREGTDDFAYIRKSKYLAKERIQVNEFQLLMKKGDHYDQHFEKHEQRIYPVPTIVEACGNAGFEMVAMLDGFSFTPASDQSNRVHFVLRRPER